MKLVLQSEAILDHLIKQLDNLSIILETGQPHLMSTKT